MNIVRALSWAALATLFAACGGGGDGASGFRLIEFLESGQNDIPRNRQIRFRFSNPVMAEQDFSSRLKIQNVIREQPTDFARARGTYLVNGEEVVFTPRLPVLRDRSDAGFAQEGSYHVFLSGGPGGLRSSAGDTVPTQQEFVFETNRFFEDVAPAEPPRSLQLLAVDPTNGSSTDLSRLDPRPTELARVDNAALIASGRVIEPGAGGAPDFATPWNIELRISEPVDPASVTGDAVQMFEVFEDALTTAPDTAAPGHFGDPVLFRVAATVETVQSVDVDGNYDVRIRVTPRQTLVDDTRYRIVFSGDILGLDFRRTFAGDNGLTGDGATIVDGAPLPEPGGLGYVSEFVVRDRPAIRASRTVHYDPLADGIAPEQGQTTLDPESMSNSALYNPATAPGRAVGFLSAFGDGTDGDLAASGGNVTVIDTGDVPNEPLGNPFTVLDLNPDDDYLGNPLPGGAVTYDSFEPFELELASLTVSTSSTLRFEGVNPVMLRVTGIVTISGVLDVAGEDGADGGGAFADGGSAGAGGFGGGDSSRGANPACFPASSSSTAICTSFSEYLTTCSQAQASFPAARNGVGPGRGLAGGDGWVYYATNSANGFGTSGGGGGSHATAGTAGEDRMNQGQQPGTPGACWSGGAWPVRLAGVIGVRGMPGPVYGDREIVTNIMGGSGGGGGGGSFFYISGTPFAGGAGGGGGGSLTIVAAGDINAPGGRIDASGGDGGMGAVNDLRPASNWDKAGGAGGGGAGGSIALISGASINLTGAIVDASGGAEGARGNTGTTQSCNRCNAGGAGGQGFIFLMDSDGDIDGFLPGRPGEYDGDPRGVLTISEFDASRFSSITAVTELFPMTAANPAYRQYDPASDVKGLVSSGQRIRVLVSSAQGSEDDPLMPDLLSESAPFEVSLLEFRNGATAVTVTGDMRDLNVIPGTPDREAFVRVQARFEYDNGVEAALGPFATIDEVTITYDFNG